MNILHSHVIHTGWCINNGPTLINMFRHFTKTNLDFTSVCPSFRGWVHNTSIFSCSCSHIAKCYLWKFLCMCKEWKICSLGHPQTPWGVAEPWTLAGWSKAMYIETNFSVSSSPQNCASAHLGYTLEAGTS